MGEAYNMCQYALFFLNYCLLTVGKALEAAVANLCTSHDDGLTPTTPKVHNPCEHLYYGNHPPYTPTSASPTPTQGKLIRKPFQKSTGFCTYHILSVNFYQFLVFFFDFSLFHSIHF